MGKKRNSAQKQNMMAARQEAADRMRQQEEAERMRQQEEAERMRQQEADRLQQEDAAALEIVLEDRRLREQYILERRKELYDPDMDALGRVVDALGRPIGRKTKLGHLHSSRVTALNRMIRQAAHDEDLKKKNLMRQEEWEAKKAVLEAAAVEAAGAPDMDALLRVEELKSSKYQSIHQEAREAEKAAEVVEAVADDSGVDSKRVHTIQEHDDIQLDAAIATSTQTESFPEGDYYMFGNRKLECTEKRPLAVGFKMDCVLKNDIGRWSASDKKRWETHCSLVINGDTMTWQTAEKGIFIGAWNYEEESIKWVQNGKTGFWKWWWGRAEPMPLVHAIEVEGVPVVAGDWKENSRDYTMESTGSKKKKPKSRRKTKKKIRSSKGSKKLKRYKRRPKSHTKRLIKKTKSRKLSKRK